MSIMKTYESRWGHHPASYRTFLLLKKLHRLYWEAVYNRARYKRWANKLPQNRVGPEPLYDWDLISAGPDIVQCYHNTRMPKPSTNHVGRNVLSDEEIRNMAEARTERVEATSGAA